MRNVDGYRWRYPIGYVDRYAPKLHGTLHSENAHVVVPCRFKNCADIYDSMAAGVNGATSVVCFLSQRYQDSPNCKLELKFSKQMNKQVINWD
eukprot:SAG31_NODE_1635_length_7682_cov_5.457471_5_plen_93_part_00